MPVDSLVFIYYHTVCTCWYWIYRYCLGQAWWRLITWCNHMAVAEWKRSMEHVWCACVWQHSHAQHRNELSGIRLSLIEQGSPWGKHVFVKWWRLWDKWVLIENLLMVWSLKWLDKIRWKEKNWLSLFECSPYGWAHNTKQLVYNMQVVWRPPVMA